MILHGLIVLWVIVCAAFDIREFRVPNILTLPPLFVAVCYSLISGGEILVRFLIVFSVLIVAWYLSALGGADVKVISTIAVFWEIGLFAVLLIWVIWSGIFQIIPGKRKTFPVMVPVALGCSLACLSGIELLLNLS